MRREQRRAGCSPWSLCSPFPPVATEREREVRGLVVMTAVVMAAGLGNKQEERGPSIRPSSAVKLL